MDFWLKIIIIHLSFRCSYGCSLISVSGSTFYPDKLGTYAVIPDQLCLERKAYDQVDGPNYISFFMSERGWQGWFVGERYCADPNAVSAGDLGSDPTAITTYWRQWDVTPSINWWSRASDLRVTCIGSPSTPQPGPVVPEARDAACRVVSVSGAQLYPEVNGHYSLLTDRHCYGRPAYDQLQGDHYLYYFVAEGRGWEDWIIGPFYCSLDGYLGAIQPTVEPTTAAARPWKEYIRQNGSFFHNHDIRVTCTEDNVPSPTTTQVARPTIGQYTPWAIVAALLVLCVALVVVTLLVIRRKRRKNNSQPTELAVVTMPSPMRPQLPPETTDRPGQTDGYELPSDLLETADRPGQTDGYELPSDLLGTAARPGQTDGYELPSDLNARELPEPIRADNHHYETIQGDDQETRPERRT